MALPPEDRKPKKKVRRKKPSGYTLPKTHQTDSSTRTEKPKAGPPSPQRTGKPTRKQPISRKRDAPPSTTDRTSDAKRSPAQRKKDKAAVDKNVRDSRIKVLR